MASSKVKKPSALSSLFRSAAASGVAKSAGKGSMPSMSSAAVGALAQVNPASLRARTTDLVTRLAKFAAKQADLPENTPESTLNAQLTARFDDKFMPLLTEYGFSTEAIDVLRVAVQTPAMSSVVTPWLTEARRTRAAADSAGIDLFEAVDEGMKAAKGGHGPAGGPTAPAA